MKKPNIIWYCTDQQRWDTISAMGNSQIRTPNLDKLIKRGVGFDNAYCQAPICTPSRASMLTGKYPNSIPLHRNGNEYFPESEQLVTKILEENDYDCGLIGKLHLSAAFKNEKRVDDGYRVFHWSHHPYPDFEENHSYDSWLRDVKGVDPKELYLKSAAFCGEGVPRELHQTRWCTEMAIEFIDEKRDKPWMLSLNPFDPHPPFDPPAEYLNKYNPKDLDEPIFQDSDITHQELFRFIDQQTTVAVDPRDGAEQLAEIKVLDKSEASYTPPDAYNGREVKAAYYAMIELIDDEFGLLVEHLEKIGELDNTIIIFHSDHGEMLGDHGLIYKGARFFDGLVKVPLIISWMGQTIENVKSDALVELVDLAPTILDFAGIEIPYDMQGKSLKPLLTGESDTEVHKNHVMCEYNDCLDLPDATHASMYFDGRYKLVVYANHDIGELYDHEADKNEFNNLWFSDEHQGLKGKLLKKHFDAYLDTSAAGINRIAPY